MDEERKNRILEEASKLAFNCFGDNLLASFVGGSYAKGSEKTDSDVDAFVILQKLDRENELRYLRDFKQLHDAYGLNFTHCGEVFDKETLERLLNFTTNFLKLLPDIQHVGCYHGDCVFSIFRKGDIVLKIIEEQKVFVNGDTDYLTNIEKIAVKFFYDHPMRRVQLEKKRLVIRNQNIKIQEIKMQQEVALEDSPMGVGLERWFHLPETKVELPKGSKRVFDEDEAQRIGITRKDCPLDYYSAETEKGLLFRKQCLALREIQE